MSPRRQRGEDWVSDDAKVHEHKGSSGENWMHEREFQGIGVVKQRLVEKD